MTGSELMISGGLYRRRPAFPLEFALAGAVAFIAMATILGLFLAYPDPGRRLARRSVERAEFTAGKGMVGDRHYGRTTRRQVNVIQARFYDWFRQSFGRRPANGSAGENVIISDDFDLNWVAVGSRFRLGGAVLHLRDFREPCRTLAGTLTPESPSPGLYVGHVGILCEVVADGAAAVGDEFETMKSER